MRIRVPNWIYIIFINLQILISPLIAQDHRCATIDLQKEFFKANPLEKLKIDSIENRKLNANVIQRNNSFVSGIIEIPVVVHVIYHSNIENISDEQIKSQIDVLNEDYAAINSTILDIPSIAWKNIVTDSKIRFRLAQQDPNGNFSTGVTRTYTINSSFLYNDSSIFLDAYGGKSAWPDSSYLNIWVCTIENNVLGFAALPGTANFRDGIVINNIAFGRKGIVKKPYNFGRTSTHEIGHWLSMRHIWGDDNGACTVDDAILDTPNQGDSHFRCPVFPDVDNCTTVSPGVMYMNYMDYTDDKCMMFFTPGQSNKMYSTLKLDRGSISSSIGAIELNTISKELSIDSILSPVTSVADRCFIPSIKLKNIGNIPISNIPILYSINGGIQKDYLFTDTIKPHTTIVLPLPTISGELGDNIFEVKININDSNNVNNYYSSSFKINSSVNSNCENSGIVIYPNPVNGNGGLHVKVNFAESQKSSIKLYNLLGQVMSETNSNINPGDSFNIPLHGFSSGLYILKIEGEVHTESVKFIFLQQ